MFSSPQDCRTICDLLAGHALNLLEPETASAVDAHMATCSPCRDEHHCLATVAMHLPSLRDALAHDTSRQQQPSMPGMARSRLGSRHQRLRRSPVRGTLVTVPLTLSQWVSRTEGMRPATESFSVGASSADPSTPCAIGDTIGCVAISRAVTLEAHAQARR